MKRSEKTLIYGRNEIRNEGTANGKNSKYKTQNTKQKPKLNRNTNRTKTNLRLAARGARQTKENTAALFWKLGNLFFQLSLFFGDFEIFFF